MTNFTTYFFKILSLQLFLYTCLSHCFYCAREYTLYEILQVNPTSTAEEIKKAFRELSRIYHPDKNPTKPETALIYQAIHEAYTILINPVKRAAYNRQLSTQSFSFMCFPNSNPSAEKEKEKTIFMAPTPASSHSELFVALQENNRKRLLELLSSISSNNFNVRHPVTQETLLDVAIRTDKPEIVSLLLSYKNININELNAYNTTPLHMAVAFNRIAIIAELIKCGADVDMPNGSGDTPLMKIAELKAVTTLTSAELLLKAGASCDIQDENGNTALHKAAAHNNTALLKLLLAYRASATIKNKKSQTAYAIALASGHRQAADLLLKHQATKAAPSQAVNQEIFDTPWYQKWWYILLNTLKQKN